MHVGIIGCGLIGFKRAESLPPGYLKAVADVSRDRAEKLASLYPGINAYSDWKNMLREETIDLVIVSTSNNWLAPITLAAVEMGKNVLVEKPSARHYKELDPILAVIQKNCVKVTVGYNLRFHPSFLKAKAIIDNDTLGPIMYIRGRYGHGGRIGYEKEWRADPEISGGGELLDQGVHLIDLSRWFLGDFCEIRGHLHTYFWNMPVEDNGFIFLKNKKGQVAWLHVSCTEWKNLFSFEIFCERGKLQIDGIGGSYGMERLTCYRMLPKMGPPETVIWEYPFPDDSWKREFDEFEKEILSGNNLQSDLTNAKEVLKIVSQLYGDQA